MASLLLLLNPNKMLNPLWIFATLVFAFFYATPTLGFLEIRVFKGVRFIYLLQVPHWDFNKGCNIAQKHK